MFFEQDIDGLWQEISFAKGPISHFDINEEGDILFEGQILSQLMNWQKTSLIVIKKRLN